MTPGSVTLIVSALVVTASGEHRVAPHVASPAPVSGTRVLWQQAPPAPRVLLDQSPRAVEYQLARLTNDELLRVERRDDDVKYRPVYAALLTRKGLARAA